tara:strand:- start:406 stop:570 length:165 start_codon:yes stop_codon:yes gene_type:complete
MFPYNDEENAWISKSATIVKKPIKHSFSFSLFFALFVALFSTTITPLIYFLRMN